MTMKKLFIMLAVMAAALSVQAQAQDRNAKEERAARKAEREAQKAEEEGFDHIAGLFRNIENFEQAGYNDYVSQNHTAGSIRLIQTVIPAVSLSTVFPVCSLSPEKL